jgi:hypothetical protein
VLLREPVFSPDDTTIALGSTFGHAYDYEGAAFDVMTVGSMVEV